jgi:alkylation response protein AidB-like acyl-CoA dehydrogenase
MNLDLTEEQEMLRNLVRQVCNDTAPLTVVRELEDDPVGYPVELWKQLADLDLIGLLLPETYGGSGMSLVEGALVYEEFGRALAPTPHFVSAILGGGIIAAAGSDEQHQTWLPRIASGESIFSVAWFEPNNGFGPQGIQLLALGDDDGYVLTGEKQHVAFASSAERLVVPVRTGDDPAAVDLLLVDPTGPGVTLEQQMTIASDTQYRVTFDGVRVPAADRIGGAGSGWSTLDSVMHDAIVLLAAQAIGGAQQVLEITVQYAKDRVQFDKPLGAFQALAHYLADAKTTIDGATVLVHEAAWARAEGRPDAARLAPMAKLFAAQTYRDTTAMAQQIHGGIGFTLEADVQLFFRRAKQLQVSWWDTRYLEELVATTVLD